MAEPISLIERIFKEPDSSVRKAVWSNRAWIALGIIGLAGLIGAWIATRDHKNPPDQWLLMWGVIAAWLWMWRFGRHLQSTAWPRLAVRLGLRFKEIGTDEDWRALPILSLWENNERQCLSHWLGGTWQDRETIVVRWQRQPPEGLEQPITVVLFTKVPNDLPTFRLAAKDLAPEVERLLENREGVLNLGRNENETFFRNYRVESIQGEETSRLFTRPMLGYFAQHPTWTVESRDGWLAVYRVGQALEPWQVKGRLEKAVEILKLLTESAPSTVETIP